MKNFVDTFWNFLEEFKHTETLFRNDSLFSCGPYGYLSNNVLDISQKITDTCQLPSNGIDLQLKN